MRDVNLNFNNWHAAVVKQVSGDPHAIDLGSGFDWPVDESHVVLHVQGSPSRVRKYHRPSPMRPAVGLCGCVELCTLQQALQGRCCQAMKLPWGRVATTGAYPPCTQMTLITDPHVVDSDSRDVEPAWLVLPNR